MHTKNTLCDCVCKVHNIVCCILV